MDVEIIGYIAGSFTTACFIPQALKIIRDRQTAGISLVTYVMFAFGVAGWIIYGLLIGSSAVIVFNILSFALTALIIYKLVTLRHNG